MSAIGHDPEKAPTIRHTAVCFRNIRLDFIYLFFNLLKGPAADATDAP
jgi:hypothetical protein